MRVLIVGVLLAGVAWLWQGGGILPPSSPDAHARAALEIAPAGVLAGLPESAVGRRVAAAPSIEEATSPPQGPMLEEAAGEVRGILVSAEAEPLPHHVVLLRRGIGVAERRLTALTDADGMFHFPTVPAGTWQAGVLVTPARGQAGATALQEVEVLPDRRAWVDLWLQGTRAIRGRILIEEEGLPSGMIFEVEARPLAEPQRIAADVIASSDAAEVFEPMPERTEIERRVLMEYFAENPGAPHPAAEDLAAWTDALAAELGAVRVAEGAVFSLGGLQAERHQLRIYLDVARSRWAEFEADLSEGDAEFGLLRLRFEDFPPRGAD